LIILTANLEIETQLSHPAASNLRIHLPLDVAAGRVKISCSREEGIIRKSVKTMKVWNLYEAVMGNWVARFENEPSLEDIPKHNLLRGETLWLTKYNNHVIGYLLLLLLVFFS
jgi:hypothetical protein